MSDRTRRTRRRTIPMMVLAGSALAVPAVATSAPVTPTADCTMLGGKDGLVGYFGYDNPNPDTVTIPVRRTGDGNNFFTPTPSNRKQPTDFAPGRHPGVVKVDMFPDQTLTWTITNPGDTTPQNAAVSQATKRCLPNLKISITGPPTGTVGQTGTWTVTVTHDGYPDISPELQPDVGIPVSSVVTKVPGISDTPLTPDSTSKPPDELLKPGQSLTYTVTGPITGQSCATGSMDQTATTGLSDRPEANTADNTATATTTVAGCQVDLGVGITPSVATTTPGNSITWTVPVTNTGNSPVNIADIHLVAPTLGNLAPAPGTPTTGVLAPGQSIGFVASTSVTAAQCGTVPASVRVAVGGDSTPASGRDVNPANDSASASVVVVCGAPVTPSGTGTQSGQTCPKAAMSVAVLGTRRVVAGQITGITLRAANRSKSASATNAVLRYRVPQQVTLTGLPAGGSLVNGVLTVKLGTLAPGASRSVRVSLHVARGAHTAAQHTARVTASCGVAITGRLAMAVSPVGAGGIPSVTG